VTSAAGDWKEATQSGDNAAMTVDETTADIREARILVGAALIIYVAALFLPLYVGLGRWENAFPSDLGARLTVGFLIHDFTVPLIIGIGLLVMSRGRVALAAGVFLVAGLFVIVDGVTRPFHAQFHARPLILMCIEFLVGALLLLAASRIVAHRAATPFLGMTDGEADLRTLLETLDPKARDDLRRVLIRKLDGWPHGSLATDGDRHV
jgi:hypothetical protein